MIGELIIAAIMATTPMPADVATDADAPQHYHTVEARITEYCPACNEPQGHGSASGAYLTSGHCACAWLPIGAQVSIDGEVFTVVDICGTDAIDIFIDDDSGECHCNMNEWKKVTIIE